MMSELKERCLQLLWIGVMLTLIAGCSSAPSLVNKEVSSIQQADLFNEDNEQKFYRLNEEEPLHITFYAHYDTYSMPQWGADPSSKWIQDKLNIHIKAINSDGNAKLKLQKMISSKQLPDLIWGDRDFDLQRMREEGLFVPLNKYIDKYPNLKKWAGDKVLGLLRAPDGNIYYFPNYYTNRPYGNAGYVLNKKIYRELGKPKLETTDDLYDYLKKVKDKYPDVVPFETGQAKDGHGIDQLFSAFKEENLGFTRIYAVPDGNRMTSIYKDEAFRESAIFVAKLMREGLMPVEAMIQTEDQISEKLMNGKVAIYASANPMINVMPADAELRKANPEDGYIFIDPIYKQGLDHSKIYPGTYNILGWNVAAITTSAKNPEAIFAMLDWMTGPEGSAVQMWGPPSPDGYWNGFGPDGLTPNFTTRYSSDRAGLARIQAIAGEMIWVGNTVYLDETKSKYERTLPEEQRNWATYWQQKVTWKSQGDATPYINIQPALNSVEGQIMRIVQEIWYDTREKALYARSDEDVLSILDEAHRASMEAGYQLYLNYITRRWQQNMKVLNSE